MELHNMRVCVIGAGAAGLITSSVLIKQGLQCTIYEKNEYIGGIWKYIEHSSTKGTNPMYQSLRTNLPVEIMSIDALQPFLSVTTSYPTHREVQEYLESFANDSNLNKFIRYNSEVTKVTKIENKWRVHTMDTTDEFDHIVVCNGHFNKPNIPNFDGIENFKGEAIHSICYDNNEKYRHKVVLIVGAMNSGTDIAWDVSFTADLVYVCNRKISSTQLISSSSNIIVKPGIVRIESSGDILFVDGTREKVDCIVWCTGYFYSCPFIEGSSNENVQILGGRAIQPLYQHMFHVEDPSLVFIGLNYSVIPFPLFNLQASFVASVITGRTALPSVEERRYWFQEFTKGKLNDMHTYHYLGGHQQFEYMKYLAEQSGILNNALCRRINTTKEIYDDNSSSKPSIPGGQPLYRDRKYEIDWDNGTWSVSSIVSQSNLHEP